MRKFIINFGLISILFFYIVSVAFAACEGDLNGDGNIDITDLGIFTADFGTTGCSTCKGDIDPDGDIDGTDLIIFAEDFGITGCNTTGINQNTLSIIMTIIF